MPDGYHLNKDGSARLSQTFIAAISPLRERFAEGVIEGSPWGGVYFSRDLPIVNMTCGLQRWNVPRGQRISKIRQRS